MKKRIIIIVATIFFPIFSYGQVNTVTLVTSGDGKSKSEAESVALRSAIEQAFGSFVSANTQILNDEIVKDEIASLSSGNIERYSIVSESHTTSKWYVTVKAVVSINKLVDYAKSHGSSAEFSGQTFAMNHKMKELNRQNEISCMQNLKKQLSLLSKDAFDLKIETLDAVVDGQGYCVPLKVSLSMNKTANLYYKILTSTLYAISLKEDEYDDYAKANIPTYKYELYTVIADQYSGGIVYNNEYVFRDKSTISVIGMIKRLPFENMYINAKYTDHTERVEIPKQKFKCYSNPPMLLFHRHTNEETIEILDKIEECKKHIKALKKQRKREDVKIVEQEMAQYKHQLELLDSYSNIQATDLDVSPRDLLTQERNHAYGHIKKYTYNGVPMFSTYYWNTNDWWAPASFIVAHHYITKEDATGYIRKYFAETPIDPIESIQIDYATKDINTLTGFSVAKGY